MVKFDVEVLVGERKFPLVAQHDLINQFVTSLVLRLMCHGLVYPSSMRFFLPYPGRKPQAKIQKYLTPLEAEKYVKLKKRLQAGKGKEEESEPLTTKQLADLRKSEQRLRVVQEFFASVLERDEGGYLHQIADEELVVKKKKKENY